MRATSEDSPPSARRTPLWESVRQIRICRTQTPEDRLPGTLPRGCAYSSRVIAVIRAPRSAAMCLVGVLAGRRAGGGCDHVCARQGCSVPVPEAGGKEKGARTEARDREKEAGRRQERGDGSEDGDGASSLTATTAGRGPHGPPAAVPMRHGAPFPLSPDEASEPTPRPLPPTRLTCVSTCVASRPLHPSASPCVHR